MQTAARVMRSIVIIPVIIIIVIVITLILVVLIPIVVIIVREGGATMLSIPDASKISERRDPGGTVETEEDANVRGQRTTDPRLA